MLLLSAAASSYLAGSGVLKALATLGSGGQGLVPSRFAQINRFLIPEWGVALVLVAAAMLVAAGGREQRLVGFYAVAVFASFLAATIACARLSYRDGRRVALLLNVVGAALVTIILGINASRLDGLFALLASGGVTVYLWHIWVSRGRPGVWPPRAPSRADPDRCTAGQLELDAVPSRSREFPRAFDGPLTARSVGRGRMYDELPI